MSTPARPRVPSPRAAAPGHVVRPAAARAAQAVDWPAQAPDAALSATARQMLDVAEKLFADRGLKGVSLREIGAAAGQRNLSAAQYHFGSREALIGAVVARRVWFINQQRLARIQALAASPQANSPRAVIEASLHLLADVVREQAWGPDYVRIVAQGIFHPEVDMGHLVDEVYWGGHRQMAKHLQALLPALPPDMFKDRLWQVSNGITYALARWVKVHGRVTPAKRARYDAMVRHTIDFLAAGMTAPLSKSA